MINLVAGMFADLFSLFCFALLTLGGYAAFYFYNEGYDVVTIASGAVAAFGVFLILFGSLATILDIRKCLRELLELEMHKQRQRELRELEI